MGTFKVLELTPYNLCFLVWGGGIKMKKYVRLPQKHELKNCWQLLVCEKFRFGYGVEGGGVISFVTPCIFHLYEPSVHTSGWTSQYSLPTLSLPPFSLPSLSLPTLFFCTPFLPTLFLSTLYLPSLSLPTLLFFTLSLPTLYLPSIFLIPAFKCFTSKPRHIKCLNILIKSCITIYCHCQQSYKHCFPSLLRTFSS